MNTSKVNQRIKSFMEKRELSVTDLSERSGLTVEFIQSMLEGSGQSPLGPLLKIARAIGVRLGTFLDDQESSDPLIIHENERKEELNVLSGKDKSVALKFHSLGRGKTDRHMEPFFIEVMPESAKEKKLSSHEGEEFILVLSGSIEVIYGKDKHVLKKGDSIYYNSVVPHYVSCAGDEKATIHAVLYIPE